MNVIELFKDIKSECLTEVKSAAVTFYSDVRGLTIRQTFYVYPDDSIVSLMSFDGGYEVVSLNNEESSIFRHLNQSYFYL